jgi:hypothetical protein
MDNDNNGKVVPENTNGTASLDKIKKTKTNLFFQTYQYYYQDLHLRCMDFSKYHLFIFPILLLMFALGFTYYFGTTFCFYKRLAKQT